ncbi:hypothetical protein [Limnohabitans sp.]|uniref:hypothetical protein n=1 Tax=Limnohabitans sp. TaxID=1907725 RepID=UPI0031FD4662
MAQIDHLVYSVAQKVIGHGVAFKNSQKTAFIEYLFEFFDHLDSHPIPAFIRVAGIFRIDSFKLSPYTCRQHLEAINQAIDKKYNI